MQANTAILLERETATAAMHWDRMAPDGPDSQDLRPTDAAPKVPNLQQELEHCRRHLAQARQAHADTTTALRCARSELRMVSAALMSSQEMERQRIACELHDSIGQALGSVGFGIGGALDLLRGGDTDAAIEMLTRLAAQTRCAIGEVRRIAMDLRPATLDHLGLLGTLSWFFREFRAVHPAIAVATDIDIDASDVPGVLTTVIYRIIQEAFTNVVRHAAASEIRVALARRAGQILLTVEDNGRGIDDGRSAGQDGLGLRSMRSRVDFSGGSFMLTSNRGGGTRIAAEWPVAGAYCRVNEAVGAEAS